MHIKWWQTLFFLLLGKKRTWQLHPHGQNTYGEIPDATEVSKIAGF